MTAFSFDPFLSDSYVTDKLRIFSIAEHFHIESNGRPNNNIRGLNGR